MVASSADSSDETWREADCLQLARGARTMAMVAVGCTIAAVVLVPAVVVGLSIIGMGAGLPVGVLLSLGLVVIPWPVSFSARKSCAAASEHLPADVLAATREYVDRSLLWATLASLAAPAVLVAAIVVAVSR